jgi:hypothetical protein
MSLTLSREIVKGDLDQESQQLIDKILDEDQKHVEFLRGYYNNPKSTGEFPVLFLS